MKTYKKDNRILGIKNRMFLVFGLLASLLISCYNEPFEGGLVKGEIITQDSELFNLISKVAAKSDAPLEEIVCIDFIYPFKVLIYDSNLEVIGDKTLTGDIEFSAFLGALPANQSISISYPLSTTLADNSVFTVNSNTELKLVIESCSREDIISYCSGLFGGNGQTKCVWKIPYIENGDNKYTSGVFEANDNGTLRFSYDGQTYLGTWVFLFINDEFHININLEGITSVALDWNIDRKVELSGDEIKIINTPKNIILKQSCETDTIYDIGSVGPAGGLVFYDKGFYTFGWRYMEAAPTDLTNNFEWGCYGSLIANSNHPEIGRGLYNSAAVTNFHDGLQDFYTNPGICNVLNNGTVAAKEALKFTSINGYKDWYLPSKDELRLMYDNLHSEALGNFADSVYWSSTGIDADNAAAIDFNTGVDLINPKIPVADTVKTRVVRCF